MRERGRERLVFAAAALPVFILLILLLAGFNPLPHAEEGGSTITLTVNFSGAEANDPTVWTLENGDWSERPGNSSTVIFLNMTAETPFEALENACALAGWDMDYENYSYGRLVTSVNGVTNGEGGAYWQYWVNDEYATVSSDSYRLSEGDIVVWSFSSSMQERDT